MIKRILSILLALVVLIGYLPVTFAVEAETVQSFSDMPDNWATPALKSAIENGLLYGYDGKIMPDSPLTRAQMAAVITRAFGAVEEGDISSYSDVKETDWFASSIAKAYKMGIMQGYAGKMDPNSNITREQVFVILARALKLKPSDTINKTFLDINEISDWAKGEVYAMVNAGYVKGSNGKLNPKANITRAEFAQVMYNIIKQYIRAAGEYTEVTDGNIMVNVPGVTLKNVKINGDLIVGDGVDDGDLVLDNVTVKGRLIVRGGGVNSIIIIGGSVEGEVIIAKVDGNIRVSVEDDADVEVIVIDDGKDNVIVEGTVGTVVVNIPDVPVVIQNATVNNIEVNCEGAADITVAEDAEVEYVVIGDKAKGSSLNVKGSITNVETSAPETKISGTGKVVTVDVNKGADNTSVTTPDSEINNKGASGVTAGGGKEVPENESVTNNSDGSDIVTSPTVTPTPVTPPRVTPTPVTPPSSDDSPSYYPVSDISVDSEIMVLKVRETGTIAVTVKPSYATNKRVNWSSDNEDVATVANGVLTAKNPGIATITVTSAADSSKKAMVRLIIGDLVVPANGSIQEAINEATEGQVIAVTPGTYEEQLIIDKPLTLLGPNAMIAGGDKRYPEAIIKGTENGLSQLLELDAENVEINGFTFDNTRIDNYNNTTGTNTNLIEGIAILNNRFVNISGTAIYLRDGRNAPGVYSKDVKICNNIIEEISPVGTADYDAGTGILVMGAEDLIISGNIISKAAYNGIQLGRNNNATITDNIVTESAQPALQIAQWNAGEHEIRGNTFSTKSEEKGAIRLYGFKNGYDPEFIITDNIIENSVYGIQIGHGDAGKNYNDIRDAKYSLSNNIFNNISDKELIIYLNEKASAEDIKAMNALFEEIYGEGYGAKLTTKEDPFVYIAGTISWADYADTSWYNDTDTEFTIDTATQLAGLAELVNSGNDFRGKTVNLGADIDLLNIEWIPIGTGNSAFKGNFDGNNKKISNLYINSNAYINRGISHNGLFGNSQAGKIENVTLENVKIIINTPDDTNYSYTGSLAGLAQFVDNVTVTGSINIEVTGGARYIGGIVGHLYNGAMTNCKLNSTDGYGLISGKYDVGGLAGYVYYGTSITDSTVQNMKINGYLGVGGVSGRIQSENKNAEFLLKDINIENIILGKLYEGTESACVGGILGYPYLGITITIKDSHLEDVKIESSHAYNGLFYGLYSNTEQHGKVILENVSYSGGEFNYLRNIVGLQKGEIAKYYSSIQAAIDEATAGDNIIKVYPGDHGTSPIVIDQKEGVNITLEAVGEVVLKNQILFYGSTRHAGEETLTIRGFTFDFSDATADTEIISAPDRLPNGSYSYAHNISIENNTFRGSLDADVVAIKTTRVFGLEIRNCEGINLHSLGQIRAQSKYLKVSDCTITNAEGGINYYGPIDAEITGLTVYGADTEYGIRAGQSSGTVSGSVLTVSDSDIEAKYPVWLRGDAPETVIITGTKLNVNAEDGQKVKNDAGSTVTIDGAYYVTTEAELRDALSKDANRIVLGDDITLTKHVNLDKHDSLELDGDGHTITVEYDATNRCGFYLASDNITIKNVTITGDQRVVGIDTKHGTKGFTIENVTFKNISIGFYANPSVEGTIQNCHFEGLGIGIGYGSDASLEITDNSFEDINKYLEIFAELSDDEINEIIENNDFDYPVKIAEQSEPVSKIVIKDEGEESEE